MFIIKILCHGDKWLIGFDLPPPSLQDTFEGLRFSLEKVLLGGKDGKNNNEFEEKICCFFAGPETFQTALVC